MLLRKSCKPCEYGIFSMYKCGSPSVTYRLRPNGKTSWAVCRRHAEFLDRLSGNIKKHKSLLDRLGGYR